MFVFNKKEKKTNTPQMTDSSNKATKGNRLNNFILTSVYILILLFAFVCSYTYVFDKKIDLGGDDTEYYLLGKAISEGDGYVNLFTEDKTPANSFPPGYPIIVGAVMKVFSTESLTTIKKVNGLFLIASIIMLFFIINKISLNKHLAFVVCFIITLNDHLLRYSTITMSEMPYMFFSFFTILVFMKMDFNKNPLKDPYFYLLLLFSVSAYYIRTIGISIFGGVILFMLVKRNWRYLLAYFSGVFVLALPWYIRGMMMGGNVYLEKLVEINPYRPEFGKVGFKDVYERFLSNAERYITKEIPEGCFNFIKVDYFMQSTISDWILGCLIIALILFGIIMSKDYKLLISFYLLGTFGVLLLWPDVWRGIRFMLPVVPILVYAIINGIYEYFVFFFSKIKKLNFNFSPLYLLPIVVLFIPRIFELHDEVNQPFPAQWENYIKIAKWSKENTEKDALICCRKPSIFYLYSDRAVTSYMNTLDKEELIKDLEKKGVDYVVMEQLGFTSTERYLLPAIKSNIKRFPEILKYKDPDTFLFKFLPK